MPAVLSPAEEGGVVPLGNGSGFAPGIAEGEEFVPSLPDGEELVSDDEVVSDLGVVSGEGDWDGAGPELGRGEDEDAEASGELCGGVAVGPLGLWMTDSTGQHIGCCFGSVEIV